MARHTTAVNKYLKRKNIDSKMETNKILGLDFSGITTIKRKLKRKRRYRAVEEYFMFRFHTE